jgi:hypothetical protein
MAEEQNREEKPRKNQGEKPRKKREKHGRNPEIKSERNIKTEKHGKVFIAELNYQVEHNGAARRATKVFVLSIDGDYRRSSSRLLMRGESETQGVCFSRSLYRLLEELFFGTYQYGSPGECSAYWGGWSPW